ncbi:uncharacterized protein [Macrobrachium rosenbergii]|uniref:uncharacterized protein n=1 Tax=Macrobrachium rosenbergii TaxID=79674 RepID=UPI0034D591D1
MKLCARIGLLIIAVTLLETFSTQNTSEICHHTSVNCSGRGQEGLLLPICRCDEGCIRYGDCCHDAPLPRDRVVLVEHLEGKKCILLVEMRVECLAGWDIGEVSDLCLKASPEDISYKKEHLLHLPVTSVDTNITYPNYFCAICNEDARHLMVWESEFLCGLTQHFVSNSTFEKLKKFLALKGDLWLHDAGSSVVDKYREETDGIRRNMDIEMLYSYRDKAWVIFMPAKSRQKVMECRVHIIEKIYPNVRFCLPVFHRFGKDKETVDLSSFYRGNSTSVYCDICRNISTSHVCAVYPGGIGREAQRPFNTMHFHYRFSDLKNYHNHLESSPVCDTDKQFYAGYCSENNNILCKLSDEKYKTGICIKSRQSTNSVNGINPSTENGLRPIHFLLGVFFLHHYHCSLLLHTIASFLQMEPFGLR